MLDNESNNVIESFLLEVKSRNKIIDGNQFIMRQTQERHTFRANLCANGLYLEGVFFSLSLAQLSSSLYHLLAVQTVNSTHNQLFLTCYDSQSSGAINIGNYDQLKTIFDGKCIVSIVTTLV